MANEIEFFVNGGVLVNAGNILAVGNTFKVALMSTAYVVDLNARFMADIDVAELNAGNGDTNGYFAGHAGTGRRTLLNQAYTVVPKVGTIWNAADVMFSVLAAKLSKITAAVIYQHRASDADSPLVCVAKFDPAYIVEGSWVIAWNCQGIAVKERTGTDDTRSENHR